MFKKVLLLIFVILSVVAVCNGASQFNLKFENSTSKVIVTDHYYMLDYSIVRDDRKIQSISLGTGPGGYIKSRKTSHGFILYGRGDEIEFAVEVDEADYSQISVSRRNIRKSVNDCVDLMSKLGVNWYGGNQQCYQYYPIQKMTQNHNSYVTKADQNQAVTERYWLNSNGVFIHVDSDAPLFIDQNNEHPGFLCLQAKRALPYDTHHKTFDFTYHVGIGLNARDVHMQAVARFLGKPSGHPDEKMVQQPIWSTWARYKRHINEIVVTEFAQEILDNGFNGQFELDDDWEECYGALTFNKQKFPNIKNLTDALHAKGFRVTLWIHPFINKDCESYYTDAKNNGRLVADHKGNINTQWWNSGSDGAAHIDFTKTEVAKWFTDRLEALKQSSGIDSFKFDAGESAWVPSDPILNATAKEIPSKITIDYVRTVAKFGSLIELKAGQSTQELPVFVRMTDRDTEWTLKNGLPTLITTLFQLNLAGYGFVLPDMIGGNGYGSSKPDKEIFLRWLQANTFMPSLQFSHVPWDYDSDTIAISHKFVRLHEHYAPYIMERFRLAVASGDPVNPPIWWLAPEDKIAQSIDDEFLLGDELLAAPIVQKGKISRDIYLPAGNWRDGNTGEAHNTELGMWLRNYSAPLDTLPYFIKSLSNYV